MDESGRISVKSHTPSNWGLVQRSNHHVPGKNKLAVNQPVQPATFPSLAHANFKDILHGNPQHFERFSFAAHLWYLSILVIQAAKLQAEPAAWYLI